MASLQRTRSLRKPATASSSTTAGPAPKLVAPVTEPSRGVSPSRLPIKPTAAPRPRSMIVAPSGKPPAAPKAATPTSRHPPSATSAGARSRPVSATLSRSASLSKRHTPTAQPTAREPPKKETSRHPPITTTSRPRQAPTTRSHRTSTESDVAVKAPSRTAAPQPHPSTTTPRRQVSHTRAKSSITTLNSTTSLRPPSHESKATSTSPQTSGTPRTPGHKRAVTADRIRPVLTTLQQQHTSPARTASPTKPTASPYPNPPLSPSKLPASVAASAETNRLQAELLQLHLLHRDAAATEAQWHASAERKLGRKFASLSKDAARVAARERSAAEEDNVLALRRWGRQGGLQGKIRVLDDVFAGIWELTGPVGRYERCVSRFERWIDHVMDVEEARMKIEHDESFDITEHGSDALFAGEMDDTWRTECGQMETRLRAWKAQLDGIGDGAERQAAGSSLDKMLDGATALVVGALAEVESMQTLERQIVAREDAWIDAMNREGENDVKDTRAGAVWRAI